MAGPSAAPPIRARCRRSAHRSVMRISPTSSTTSVRRGATRASRSRPTRCRPNAPRVRANRTRIRGGAAPPRISGVTLTRRGGCTNFAASSKGWPAETPAERATWQLRASDPNPARLRKDASRVFFYARGLHFPSAYFAMITITLPDNSTKSFDHAPSVRDVAASIGAGLAKAALAGKVDGKLVDLSRDIDHDARVEIVTEKSPEALDIIRHSTAHLLAQAVQRLYPGTQVTIGPVIDDGFYYDFAPKGEPFKPEDLPAIEAEMQKIAKESLPLSRSVKSRDEAVKFFRGIGEDYKAEIIESIPSNEELSLYSQGEFTDLCRGPHVPDTGRLKAFKLMKTAGAYWRGDSDNAMLSRIYGTAWLNDKDLKAYLTRIEEAEKRDHRKLGRQLDLFHMQEEAPGMAFWHAKGWTLWQQVEQYMRRVYRDSGYQEVKCPSILDVSLWKKSGHWDNYKNNMFFTESEKRTYAVKPMNCPGHVQIYNDGL